MSSRASQIISKDFFRNVEINDVSLSLFWAIDQFEKTETTENLKNLVSVASKWLGCGFVGQNCSYSWIFIWTELFLAGSSKGHIWYLVYLS